MSVTVENRLSKRLVKNHLPLAVVSLAAIALLDWFIGFWLNAPEPKSFYFRLSLATGYVALVLLVITLSIGAVNVLRKKRNPVSTDWRRDVGIWCAFISVAHFIVGWNVHMKNRFEYFFTQDWLPRTDAFGVANYTGLLAVLIAVVLLAVSNDFALRKLKARRWKSLQRWNYALALLVVAHTILYQILDKRPLSLIVPIALLMAFGLIVQILGFQQYRKLY